MPKISVVIITYNRAPYIGDAIDSVIRQSFLDWELIIIDDASTDNTKMILKNYIETDPRIKYVENLNNTGISTSRNKALEIARGKYVAILDSDDIWADEEKLQKQYDFLEKNPEYVLIGGAVITISADGQEVGRYKNPILDSMIRKGFLLRNPFINSSVMFSRDVAIKCGGYKNYTVGEDYDLFLKMGKLGKLSNLSGFLVKYRKHDSGITWSRRVRAAQDHLSIIAKFKCLYPNYLPAFIKGHARLFLAKLISWNNHN